MGQFGQQKGQPAPNAGKKYPAQTLTPAEVEALIAQCGRRGSTGIRNRALLMLLYRSGLRISEILAIKPHDLDTATRTIRLLDTKSGEPQTRAYHPAADDSLARWIEARKKLHTRGAPLFCTLKGGEINAQQIRNLVKRLALKAGIEKRVHPHAFRHTFADESRRAGGDVVVISDLLGHSSIAVTDRYLRHLGNHEAVAALGNLNLPVVKA